MNNTNSYTQISQLLLEQNEDTIAAVVENLQLGRLEDCIKHYTVLQANLVAFALELDNYPTSNSDAYEFLDSFPDLIMRKDILEDLQPHGSRKLPEPPLIPPCMTCSKQKIPSETCRLELNHVDPSAEFSSIEREQFLHATQVITARHRQVSVDREAGKIPRAYKLWDSNEKYSLLLAGSVCGLKDINTLCKIFEGTRAENQIRSYISKNLKNGVKASTMDLIRNAPKNYSPPPLLAYLFSGETLQMRPPTGPVSMSSLAPGRGGHDWNHLMTMAAGVKPPTFSSSSSFNQQQHQQLQQQTFQPPLPLPQMMPMYYSMPQLNPVGSYLPPPGPQWPPNNIMSMPPQYPYNPIYAPKMEVNSGQIHQSTVLHALPSLTANLPYALHPPLTAPSTLNDPLKEKISTAQQEAPRTYYAMQCDRQAQQMQQQQMQMQYGGPMQPVTYHLNQQQQQSTSTQPLQRSPSKVPGFAKPGLKRRKQQLSGAFQPSTSSATSGNGHVHAQQFSSSSSSSHCTPLFPSPILPQSHNQNGSSSSSLLSSSSGAYGDSTIPQRHFNSLLSSSSQPSGVTTDNPDKTTTIATSSSSSGNNTSNTTNRKRVAPSKSATDKSSHLGVESVLPMTTTARTISIPSGKTGKRGPYQKRGQPKAVPEMERTPEESAAETARAEEERKRFNFDLKDFAAQPTTQMTPHFNGASTNKTQMSLMSPQPNKRTRLHDFNGVDNPSPYILLDGLDAGRQLMSPGGGDHSSLFPGEIMGEDGFSLFR